MDYDKNMPNSMGYAIIVSPVMMDYDKNMSNWMGYAIIVSPG